MVPSANANSPKRAYIAKDGACHNLEITIYPSNIVIVYIYARNLPQRVNGESESVENFVLLSFCPFFWFWLQQ